MAISKNKEKMCNICGELTLVYSVVDNAPICNDCKPIKKVIKSETKMLQAILNHEKEKNI